MLSVIISFRQVNFVICDNICALGRFVRHARRRDRTMSSQLIAALTFVLDAFHVHNHASCTDPNHAFYMPEVQLSAHPDLQNVNTQTCEHMSAWMDTLCPMLQTMIRNVFKMFRLLVGHYYNLFVAGCLGSRATWRRGRRSQCGQETHCPSAAVTAGTAETTQSDSSLVSVGYELHLARNPHGVGLCLGNNDNDIGCVNRDIPNLHAEECGQPC